MKAIQIIQDTLEDGGGVGIFFNYENSHKEREGYKKCIKMSRII